MRPVSEALPFPPTLQFGVATAAYQVEGHLETDWSAWERAGKLHDPHARNGRACEHWARFFDDIALIQNLGVSMYRLSLEWARIEPTRGHFDDTAIRGYRERLEALVKAGLRPVVTLHHFTHPPWFHEATPWHSRDTLPAWQRYVRCCLDILRGLDCAVVTLNEPNVLMLGGYLSGQMPPGLNNGAQAFAAAANMMRAHAIAVDLCRGIGITDIGIAQNMLVFGPSRVWHPIDQALTRLAAQGYNHAFFECLTTGTLRLQLPGVMSGTERIEGAENSLGFCGINYYTRAHLKFITRAPFIEFTFRDVHRRGLTDIGWEYYPEGFEALLGQLKRYQRPIWVTENGLDDRAGTRRNQYLFDHLQAVERAIAAGADVRAYLHWSLMDNFEWLEAWGPRFGLYRVNFETLERTETPSVAYYRQLVTSRTLVPPP